MKERKRSNGLWDCVAKAIRKGDEIKIPVEADGFTAEIKTIPASKVWETSMLIQIRTQRRGFCTIQTFDNVGSAMEAFNAENGRANRTE